MVHSMGPVLSVNKINLTACHLPKFVAANVSLPTMTEAIKVHIEALMKRQAILSVLVSFISVARTVQDSKF